MSKLLKQTLLGLSASIGLGRLLFTTVTVSGQSMWPTMGDKDVWLAYRNGRPTVGRVVLMREPADRVGGSGHMVKRLLAVNETDEPLTVTVEGEPVELPPLTVWAVGDNRENSLDSRDLGPMPLSDVRAFPFRLLTPGNSTMDPMFKGPRPDGLAQP